MNANLKRHAKRLRSMHLMHLNPLRLMRLWHIMHVKQLLNFMQPSALQKDQAISNLRLPLPQYQCWCGQCLTTSGEQLPGPAPQHWVNWCKLYYGQQTKWWIFGVGCLWTCKYLNLLSDILDFLNISNISNVSNILTNSNNRSTHPNPCALFTKAYWGTESLFNG